MRTIPRFRLNIAQVVILLYLVEDIGEWWSNVPTRDQLEILLLIFPYERDLIARTHARLIAEAQTEGQGDKDDEHFCTGPGCCTVTAEELKLLMYGPPQHGKVYAVENGRLVNYPGPIPPDAQPYVIAGYNDDEPDELDVFYADRREKANGQECDICGEPADAEMGEFWDHNKDTSVVAHAQCGLDAGLELA